MPFVKNTLLQSVFICRVFTAVSRAKLISLDLTSFAIPSLKNRFIDLKKTEKKKKLQQIENVCIFIFQKLLLVLNQD